MNTKRIFNSLIFSAIVAVIPIIQYSGEGVPIYKLLLGYALTVIISTIIFAFALIPLADFLISRFTDWKKVE